MKDGGPTWSGVWAMTNPPEIGSYWHAMMEGLDPDDGSTKPNGWAVFKQPPGLLVTTLPNGKKEYRTNPQADNLNMLPPGYYENLAKDKSDEYIKVYALGQYGTSRAGKPVHPLFNEATHVTSDILIPNRNQLLVVAADFGRTPAMVLMQQDAHGRVCVLDEIVTEGMGIQRCIKEKLKPLLRNKYEGFNTFITGDPSGNNGVQTDEKTCVSIFKDEGFKRVKLAYSNNPIYRQGALDSFLSRVTDMGPAFLVSPNCKQLIRALSGGYHFKIAKNGITSETPEKNMSSHINESLHYGAMYFEKGVDDIDTKQNRDRALAASRMHAGSYTRRS